MNRKDILDLIGSAKDSFVMEAIESREGARPVRKNTRVMLIAAVIAVTLLLVGCTAAYFWLQDMAIGSDIYVKQYDEQGKALDQPIEIERQILTFAGYAGSNSNKAVAEWYAFRESYDPEGKYMTNTPDLPDIPNNYEWVYGCYTQELMDKLNEIAAKYDMKLLEEWVPVQHYQSDVALQEGLKVNSLLKPGTKATMDTVSGMLYPPYNFKLGYYFSLTDENAAWTKKVWVDEYYYHKEYLPANGAWHLDMSSFEQWNYTTADGVDLLMAMNDRGLGFMIQERDDVFQAIAVNGNTTGSAYPEPDQVPGREALEQMAEAFDFGITVAPIDAQAMKPAMDAAEEKHKAENVYIPETFGSFTELLKESTWLWADNAQYTFRDMNSDGQEDLLIGFDGQLHYWYQVADGTVQENFISYGYLCENGIYEVVDTTSKKSSFVRYYYHKMEDGVILEADRILTHYCGKWYDTLEPLWLEDFKTHPHISTQEVEKIRSQYVRLELDWKPIYQYPLDDKGAVLEEYIKEQDIKLSDSELREFYAEKMRNSNNSWVTHYRILDINEDGIDDLLLSDDGEKILSGYTHRYGVLRHLSLGDTYLCENGIFEQIGQRIEAPGIEIEEHTFFRVNGLVNELIDYVAYDKSTASWMCDYDFTPISEEEAREVIGNYKRIDLEFLPISDLIG